MTRTNAAYPDRHDRRYISTVMEMPLLEREHEANLARRWREKGDERALDELITAHIRLVVKIASGFRGYGLPVSDLIQEGNIGLMEAANRFDTERQVRFSTYATWWVLAAIQEYIVRNSSVVRIGTTPAQKSLFFNLRRLRAKLTNNSNPSMTDEERKMIAKELGVPLAAVERMESHLSRPDRSLNQTIGNDDSDELMNFLEDGGPTPEEIVTESRDHKTKTGWLEGAMDVLTEREQEVISRRFLTDKKVTLAEIGDSFGVTKERVRQIEAKALSKLKNALSDSVGRQEIFVN